MNRKLIAVTILLSVSSLVVFAQSAQRVDAILARRALDRAPAAYLAAASAGLVEQNVPGVEALAVLEEAGFNGVSSDPHVPVRRDEFAYMLMIAHGLNGGIMYSLFPGPRYALREMRHERLMQNRGDPGEPISGERAMRIVGRVLTFVEETQ